MADGEVRQSLHEKIFGDTQKTDHGGIGLGDILVLLLDGFLFVFTAFFSWEFLQSSMPIEYKTVAIAGLAGLDAGMVAWSLVWIYGSTTQKQNWASITMWLIDFIGVCITTFTGFFTGRGASVPTQMQSLSLIGVVSIILLNVFAGFIYHFNSPRTQQARQRRKMLAELQESKEKGDAKIEREKLQLVQDEAYLTQRAIIVEKERVLAQQQIAQEDIDRNTRAVLARMRGETEHKEAKESKPTGLIDQIKTGLGGNGNGQRALGVDVETIPNDHKPHGERS